MALDQKVLNNKMGFAPYPSIKLYNFVKSKRSNKTSFKAVEELIFGDYIRILFENEKLITTTNKGKEYIKVRSRGENAFIDPEKILPNRILEVNFVDVAQGDGCHVVTPEDKHFIIDAGKGDNMVRFLTWRFNLNNPNNKSPVFTGIISHCDEDHYGGFTKIFEKEKNGEKLFKFDTIYQNGIVEESGKPMSKLGKLVEKDEITYVTNLVKSRAGFEKRKLEVKKAGRYIKCLNETDAKIKFLKFGSSPIYNTNEMKIEVLGPITQKISNKDALPVFDSSKGRTKNGHSIILKLKIGKLKMLLGGDLNSTSENYLIEQFTGINIKEEEEIIHNSDSTKAKIKKAAKNIEKAIEDAREKLQVDIAKSCHHGSSDFTIDFLKILNPVATVISSGDDEPHSHPRPDTLGTIGKYSRGEKSLIFSTELARSTKEYVKTANSRSKKDKIRAVTVYGMINIRTDGTNTIIAQKLEREKDGKKWDIHKIAWDKDKKGFRYVG